jgi:hypothetical protein
MGILDGLSAGLTAATKAATGVQAGKREGSALLRAMQMEQVKADKERAEIGKITADTGLTNHRNRAPVLGEAGYNEAKGGEAGAIADAQVAPHVRSAVETAEGVEPIHTRGIIAQAAGVAPIEENKQVNIARRVAPIRTAEAVATANGVVGAHIREAEGKAKAELPYKLQEKQAEQGFKQPTHDEAYTASHLPRIASALGVIEKSTAPGAWQKIAERGMFGNYTLGPEAQQYNAAVHRAALSLAVTMEGPRGATPQRVEMVKKTYFPAPGDDAETVKSKLAELRGAISSGITKAGRGYERMGPNDKAILARFLDGTSESAPAAVPAASTGKGTYTYGGVTYKVP